MANQQRALEPQRLHVEDEPGIRRLRYTPFETMIALWTLVAGVVALAGLSPADPLRLLLPPWLRVTLDVMTALSGATMLVGMVTRRARAEGVGLALLAALILIRLVAYVDLIGWTRDLIVGAFFYAAIWWACLARLRTLRHGAFVAQITVAPLEEPER